MSSPHIYDYNEVEELLQKPHCSKHWSKCLPNATRVKRDWRRDRYFGYRLRYSDRKNPHEELPQFEPHVEYSLNKKKRWDEVKATLQTGNFAPRPVAVTVCTPKRGSNWWDCDDGYIDMGKLDDRLVWRAAQKGKSKNMTLLSVCEMDAKPTLHFSIVRCYDDTSYRSQLTKYRKWRDHEKRKTFWKMYKRPVLEEDI
ncbi:hypothetical protein ANCCAN_15777 [Ancylostoma caninum]|uniref:Uncharacterized protein n=1 Tax=Ancylostoma caninum TaxID=29170 RepID=A0A368G6K1_ANCCA|nr:hypothetical protein ANCCAN_15777 [Ancylostoma caninum]